MGAFFDMSVLASLAFLAVMLLVGVLLRAKVTFFQNFLVPACIIGGIIGAIIMNTTSIPGINQKLYEQLAYHFFAFSFICLGLRGTGCIQKEECSDTTKELVKGSIWQGFMFYMSMCSQVLVATAVIYLINFIFQKDFLASMGFLGAQGFTAGPGATLSSGLLWEKFGHANMGQVGLAFSGIGFIVSFVIGVPLVRWGLRKKLNTFPVGNFDKEMLTGIHDKENTPVGMHQVTTTANVDSLAFHIALVLGTWIITYYLVDFITFYCSKSIAGTIWGNLFFVGMILGMGIRFILTKFNAIHIIDSDTMNRLTGWSVEFLLLCTLAGVQFAMVAEYWLPIITVSLVLAFYALFFCLYFGRRVPGYSFERTVMLFGTVTGTIPTGLLLLRMVDNEYKSTVSVEIALSNFNFCFLFYVNLSLHGYAVYGWGMPATLAVFSATFIGLLILSKLLKNIGPKQY